MIARDDQMPRQLHVDIHHEDGSYWAEVRELPGCFASGDTAAELIESVEEAVALYSLPRKARRRRSRSRSPGSTCRSSLSSRSSPRRTLHPQAPRKAIADHATPL
jgi:hypothetical protein